MMGMRERGTPAATGLRVLSLLLGVFILFMGMDKIGWLTNTAPLLRLLQEWREAAPPASRWYLETIAIPGAPIFARLVPVGELLIGSALIAGIQVRLAAALMIAMVLNFHFASDVLFHYSYLTNAYGLPVLGGLLALALGGGRLPFSLSR
jgi:uncharacterized membrane protein YphA (DoxX/SURF4 family)